jgi:NADH-quinone oxidoreductase subunit L
MFWLPILIAYITPFYMMRVWWLTFMGKPRDHHVYDHAHESPLMYVPLVVLAIGTVIASYWLFRPSIVDAGVHAANATLVVAVDGENGAANMLGLTHEPASSSPHHALINLVGFSWVVGMGLAALLYFRGLGLPERIRRLPLIRSIHTVLEQKFFFDHLYEGVLVNFVKTIVAGLCRAVDTYIVDTAVNMIAALTVRLAYFSGRTLDTAGVDGVVDGLADTAKSLGDVIRQPHTGRIRNYVLFGTAGAALVLVAFAILAWW